MSEAAKVWLITGVSSGLGRKLAEQVLANGDAVFGTVLQQSDVAAFEALAPLHAVATVADVTEPSSVDAAVRTALERFGRIDVLANNAGRGLIGAVEETSDAEARAVFDINFFGGLAVTRAVLPAMRRQRSGHILNFSAIGGFTGFAGLGVYSAAKAAVDIVSEAVAKEVGPFGIKVTVLTIGVFRTNFAAASVLTKTAVQLADYADTPAGTFRRHISQLSGAEPNDPDRAAAAIIALVEADRAPMHLALGADAVEVMREKIAGLTDDLDAWEPISRSTTFTQ